MSELPLADAKGPKTYTTAELVERVRAKYSAPAWVTLTEVRDGTGFATAGREADVVAFGTWPSRGLAVLGFEVKKDRSDWLREMKNPAKAEAIARFCDEWWVVANRDVVKLEELPPAWGLFTPKGGGLGVERQATRLTPEPVDRLFLMSVVRNVAANYTHNDVMNAKAQARAEVLAAQKTDEYKYKLERAELSERILANFKAHSGIDLAEGNWRETFPQEVGAVVKAVMRYSLPYEVEKLHECAKQTKEILDAVVALPFFKKVRDEMTERKKRPKPRRTF
jgi:hypothetical protein